MSCRILYVVGQLGSGGLERQLYLLLRTLDRDRYRPEVVVWNFREDATYLQPLRALDVPIHFFSGQHSRAAKVKAFRRLVSELEPEVIHSYTFYTNFAAHLATLGTKSIAIGAVRSNFIYDKRSSGLILGSLSARWPRVQIYNNLASAKTVECSYKLFAPRRALVVRNGIDLEQFRSMPIPTNGRIRIVGVGSLIELKRWDRLIRAASHLKIQGLDFQVEVAGGGPLREPLQRLAQELDVADRVTLKGHTETIPSLLASSTFLAHTSDVEGCPNVVMEAMACGRAVVAIDAGDIPSLVEDGKTGFVIRRGDDRQIVERLATLITNRDLCRQMGEAGRIKAERKFGLNRLVDETLAVYRAVGWRDS